MFVFLICVLLLFLGGCSNEKPKGIATEYPPKISLVCQKSYDVATIDNIEVIIENGLEDSIYFGEDYFIEKLEEDSWCSLPLEIAYNSIGFCLANGAKQKMEVPLLKKQYKYKSGSYRIMKEFRLSDGEVDTVYAQFYLEEGDVE